MTMANAAVTSPARTGVSLRKTNKPLMEKRRRARINDSLTQLKSLVIQGSKKDSSQFNKLEKADILELTVKHLRNLQAQQQQQAHISQAGNNDPSLAGKYQAGFMECANEVIRYLGQSQGFSDDIKARVISHLASCIQLSSKSSFSKPIQPNTMAPSNTSIMAAGQQATSTAQLANGQIIQIVNSPYQTVKPSSMNQFPVGQTVQIAPALPSTLAASSASSHISAAARSTSAVTNSTSTSSPEPAQYIRYTQPLHIQIPPVLSPILIQPQPQSQSQQPKPVQTQVMATRVRDLEPQVVAHLPTPPQAAAISSSSTSPQSQDRCQSPPPHRPIQRLHPAYIQDDLNSDLLPRTRTYSMTSSSSSSESELVSPLNLSQSPQYYDSRKEDFTNKYSSHDSRQLSRGCPQYEKLSPSQPMYRDSLVSSHFHSSNCTSVIVDGRKTLDSHALKYMHMMMDDDRHCMPHEGSTSPASSVGEERLWRPW